MKSFRLLDGLTDSRGVTHREGILRPATAADEIRALQDFRLHLWPERFLEVVLPSVLVRLGGLEAMDAGLVQRLSARDRDLLEGLYCEVNGYAERT